MKTATVRSLRNDYAKLLRRVETGEEIAISRRGKIVARLMPPITGSGKVDWSASAARSLARDSKPMSDADRSKLMSESQGAW
ncbi:MAG TPA: type II toxin-antitoxin system prevent-host-death family antitoxin [Chthoniobacter sp.]|nr:type II toxin-antitoxin system prevent-host-death family antitoxin [Chthoniobacter sp.]